MTAADILAFNELQRVVEAQRLRERADREREVRLEAEVKRLRAAYDAALRNAVLSKQYGDRGTPPAYAQHEKVWQHALAEDAARVVPYNPFGQCWR